MTPLTVVCWKWPPQAGYRSTFGPETVNTLRAMVRRHYPHPHRFVCVTRETAGIDADIEILPPWDDFAHLPSPHGQKNPSCYRRLRLFHPDAQQWFGARFVSLDLDVVITGDLTPLWHRPEPVVFWGDTNRQPGSHYNGSMILMDAGCRPQVWTDFSPEASPLIAKEARCFGSDQGWISYRLGPGEAKWSKRDGVYSYRNEVSQLKCLPSNARIVVFHGAHDPWASHVQATVPWVREHYTLGQQVPA